MAMRSVAIWMTRSALAIADCIEAGSSAQIVGEVNDLTTAKVYVDATTPEGGTVPYEISLVRRWHWLEDHRRNALLHLSALKAFE